MTSDARSLALSIAPAIKAATFDLRRSTRPVSGLIDGVAASERRITALASLDELADSLVEGTK